MKSQDLTKKNIPDTPGVYLWKKGKTILYIGKATSLRNRIKSYFASDLIETRGQAIVDMVFKSTSVSWEETDSVLEALVYEAALIKKYQPKYNVKEKDNKSFNYVVITKDVLPQVVLVRGRTLKIQAELKEIKPKYVFGPFTSGSMLKEALKIIRKIFPYEDVYSSKKDNYQFYRQLGLAPDVSSKEGVQTYQKNIRHIALFFQGKKKEIIKRLETEMKEYAKKELFEKAGQIKKQIFALTHINDVALMKYEINNEKYLSVPGYRIEGYDVAHISGSAMVGVMTVASNGVVDKSEYKKFIIKSVTGANDPKALEEMLMRRFRHLEWGLPDLVVVDGNDIQRNVALRVLKIYQLTIPVVSVVKDEKHKPKALIGDSVEIKKHKRTVVLVNAEAHRFAITFHKQKRAKLFLSK